MIVTFIPAAGQSTRMVGKDKLLEPVDGVPILARTVKMALKADLGPVLVGLEPDKPKRRKLLEHLNITIVDIPDAKLGMSATLRRGAEQTRKLLAQHALEDDDGSGMMILLPDMPEITLTDIQAMETAFISNGGKSVRAATKDGKPGHPTIFAAAILKSFETLTGDKGAAALFQHHDWVQAELSGDRARRDLDTPEDWAKWRQDTNTPN